MITVSPIAFEQNLDRFKRILTKEGHAEFRDFNTGWIHQREEFKTLIHERAVKELDSHSWKESDIGSGNILKRIISAIEQREKSIGKWMTLVEWSSKYGKPHHAVFLNALASSEETIKVEQVLYNLYQRKVEPSTGFEQLRGLGVTDYDCASYPLFLLDWEHFMQCRPSTFQKAFELLGVKWKGESPRLVQQCSWNNYQQFNDTLKIIRNYLLGAGIPNVRLVDAHSFCWTLGREEILPEIEFHSIPKILPLNIGSSSSSDSAKASAGEGCSEEVDFENWAKVRALLGKLAHDKAVEAEKARLKEAGRDDLAARVDGDKHKDHKLGYDILSYEAGDGKERFIEVKAARRTSHGLQIFLTENEREKSHYLPNYHYYLVIDPRSPKCEIRYLKGPELKKEWLTNVVYQAAIPTSND